jgi:CBS domain-containing protein
MDHSHNVANRQKRGESPPLKELAGNKVGVLAPHDSVRTAGERMRQANANAWPVAEDRKLVGMISEIDPDRNMETHGHDPQNWRVGEVMKRQVVFCYEDEDCDRARQIMDEHRINHVAVVDRAMQIIGVFSREEVTARAQRSPE